MIDIKRLLENLKKANIIAIDTETISLDNTIMVGFSVSYEDKKGLIHSHYIPIKDLFLENLNEIKARDFLNIILKECHLVFHNSSFDIPVLAQFGANVYSIKEIDDTVLMAHLVNENMQHGLKHLVKKYFKYEMLNYKDICGTGKSFIPFHEVDNPKKEKYAEDDARYTLALYKVLKNKLMEDPQSQRVYEELEKPLLPIVADIHTKGININFAKVSDIAKMCKDKITNAEIKLQILMGDINFNSPKQLKEYFIDKCHLPAIKISQKTNVPSVDKEVLEIYAENGNNEAKLLLEHRKYSKIYSTFIPALTPQSWDAFTKTGYIYASFNQAGTVTGRFSSSRPNMQNIPHDDDLGLREAIIADKGDILIGADYSQIELRVLAHFSQDANLMTAYQQNKDIHQQTADACGIDRYKAKTINFGLVYGMGYKTLAKRIKVHPEEAKEFIRRYFATYPGVKKFWDESERHFRQIGYTQTAFGRKRRKSNYFYVKDEYDQGAEVRSALNSIIQGTAADLMKKAMITMWPQIKTFGARIVSTVHDEVIVSCPIENAEKTKKIIIDSMKKAGQSLTVPIEVDCKFGRTWAEAHGEGIKLEEIK